MQTERKVSLGQKSQVDPILIRMVQIIKQIMLKGKLEIWDEISEWIKCK